METKTIKIPHFFYIIEKRKTFEELLDEGKTFSQINEYFMNYERKKNDTQRAASEEGTYFVTE